MGKSENSNSGESCVSQEESGRLQRQLRELRRLHAQEPLEREVSPSVA